MSVRLQHVTRIYGQQKAVNDVTFEVGEGEIVGFLGPNGAGKSTTMKMITGYIPATAGLVDVGGFDVGTNPLRVKKLIGYLPEHNPLYTEMYVREHLLFSGSLYGLRGQQLKTRVEEMIERCGLVPEANKKIEALSKGYRQRVGLAQALLHNPRILILDEPTSGLDPNQLAEIRKLIKDVSMNKTVIFSSHIMQEVEALCDRVIVINKGSIVADDSLSNLVRSRAEKAGLIIEFAAPVDIELLKTIPHVDNIEEIRPGIYRASVDAAADVRSEIFRFAADHRLALQALKDDMSTLESVFQELTR